MTRITQHNTPWFDVDSLGSDYLAARFDLSDLERPVLHHFSMLTPVQYRRLSGHLLAFGFDVIDDPIELSTADDEGTLTVRKQSTMTTESIASTRRTLDDAVEKFGGRYESWSTYIVIASRRQLGWEKLESIRDRVPGPRRQRRTAEPSERR